MNFIQKTGAAWAISCLLLCSIGWAQTAGTEVTYKPTLGQMGKDVMWLPTPKELVDNMLSMAQVNDQALLYDLGAGDGVIAITAAKKHGARAVGIEYNPDMAQTFDKLSEKLATELAGRMHEKLNAGEWKMKFALKPASLGLVDVQLEMRDGKLTAQFNADTSLTQELIQNGSQRLKEALGQLGMNNASVLVGQGQSQQQGQASNSSNPSRQGDDNRVKLADESGVEPLVQAKPRHSNSLQFDNYA